MYLLEVGRVSPKANSSGLLDYDFIDSKPETDKSFYRLKLLYKNNSFTYSNPILVSKSQNQKNITVSLTRFQTS